MVRLLTNENPKIREYSSLALSNLTYKNHNNWRHILNHQGVEPLVHLMKDEKDTTKAYACICLTNMANDEVIREEAGQFQFCQSLIPALTTTYAKSLLIIANFITYKLKNNL